MSKNQDLGELINGIKALATNQLNAPAYTSASSFTGTLAGLLGFDSSGNVISLASTSLTLNSSQITTALGFTPYNATNPSGYISGITSLMVTTALGYTPYNSSNPSGYISGINSGMVTSALGYTPVPTTRTITINGVTYDLSADRSWTVSGSGVITGSGTNNYVTKWTGTTSIGNSNIQDSGTLVSINSETYVNGLLSASKAILYGGPEMIRMYASTPFISFYDATNVTRFGYIQAYAGLMDIVAEASNPLNFNVGGSNRMRILTNGNVGIGTTSPTVALDVVGAGIFSGSVTATSLSSLFKEGYIVKATTTGGGGSQPAYTYYTAAGSKRWASFLNVGDDKYHISNASNTELFTITQSGNVGIGTSSPSGKLHLTGGSSGADLLFMNTSGANTNFAFKITGAASDYLTLRRNHSTGGNIDIMSWTYGGNVGIGTTSPDFPNGSGLVVYASDFPRIQLRNSTTGNTSTDGAGLFMVGNDYYISNRETGNMIFENGANTERMRITNTGVLAIGSTTSYRGNSGINIANKFVCITTIADTNSGGTHIEFVLPNNQIVGNITTNSSNTTYSTSSDYRLKTNFEQIKALELIHKLKMYQFNWKVDNSLSYGVQAHELQEVIPYAVVGQKDGKAMQSVDYSKLTPIAIAGVQQLHKLFESHAEKIARLEAEVSILKQNNA